jgi:predicted TIM-barrel fold metal-dependent hydrolase
MKPLTIYNIHTHIFTIRDVPPDFLPFRLAVWMQNPSFARFFRWLLRRLLPFTKNDALDRLAVFAQAAVHKNQSQILTAMMGFYPEQTRFGVLSMDFDYMMDPERPRDQFLPQVEELARVKQDFGGLVLPFLAVDPRRPGLLDLVEEYTLRRGFCGLKLYPPLGFFPFDERLKPVYRFAQERGIPLISHCSKGGIHFRYPISADMRRHPLTGEYLPGRSQAEFAWNYTRPENYIPVLEEFPGLKICLAHFGGDEEWLRYLEHSWPPDEVLKRQKQQDKREQAWLSTITDMMARHENLYADIAYTAFRKDLLPLVKVLINTPGLREKILYGSDCYMVQLEESERAFSINVRGYLGEKDYRQIAETNPKKFTARTI